MKSDHGSQGPDKRANRKSEVLLHISGKPINRELAYALRCAVHSTEFPGPYCS
jgi:hypothetical protein